MNFPDIPNAKVRKGSKSTGNQAIVEFPNGYSASVISDGYGEGRGLYEIAVMHSGCICYDTPVTDDVLGYLSEQEVIETCNAIGALEPRA